MNRTGNAQFETTSDLHGMQKSNRFERWVFFLTFITLGALIAGAFVAVYSAEYRELESDSALDSSLDLKIQEEIISFQIQDVLTDVLYLTRTNCLEEGLQTGDFEAVSKTFRIFGEAKKRYAQLRFLDSSGMEVVRVNVDERGAVVVPDEDLQDKADRYYYRDSRNLTEGEVFVSPLDLNIEQGRIEQPENPMIRFASPVYSGDEFRGIVVINYSASILLEEIRKLGEPTLGDFYLLNSDGYYLVGPDRQQEWGFMYPERDEHRLDVDYPGLWNSAAVPGDNIVEDQHTLLAYRHIYPLSSMGLEDRDYFWIAASLISKSELRAEVGYLRVRLFLLGSFLFVFSVIPAWGVSQLVSRRARKKHELMLAARFDSLTGLPNRILGMDRLKQTLSLCRRYRWNGVLLFIDLDGFKAVNDHFGHDAGDYLLREVGQRLLASVRESDTCIRFGGDEFLVVVPREDNDPGALAGKLIEVISRPYRLPGNEALVGASIGVRVITAADDETPESLIKDADTAMYEAKSRGKGQYAVYDPGMNQG